MLNKQDILEIRSHFPILKREISNHPLAYLDTANSAQKPQSVIDAIANAYANHYSNVHRGVHQLGYEATESYEKVRDIVKDFINASTKKEIVFTKGATEAINLVAHSYPFEKGDVILVSEMEHHSNIVPWQLLKDIEIKVIPFRDSGELDMEAYKALLNQGKVKLVAITHMSNALGTINPIREICALAKAKNALILVDGCQAAMHMTVDVQALGCDFYAFSAHKLYGPSGAGVLWGKYTHLETMSPYQGGGEMIASVSFEKTTFAEAPIKFEAGTPPIVQVIGMGEAIKYIQSIGIDNIQSYESHLLEYATTQLTSTFPELTLYGQAKDRSSILSFTFSDVHAHDVCTILNSKGVAARAGHHCAQPIMQHYQIAATTRASIGLYNTESDIDALVTGLKTVQEVFQS